jgi:hypothetical protein
MGNRLTIFETDEGITIAFGSRTYYIHHSEPFHNIAKICIEKNDYVPFYVEIARREGVGEELKQELMKQVEILQDQKED